MKVLIIGGGGLLGTHLAPLLVAAGHTVSLCDNLTGSIKHRIPKGYDLRVADATQQHTMRHVFEVFKPDAVILAASRHFLESIVYSSFEDVSTILNSANVLSSLLTPNVKWVCFCSSAEVYGLPNPRIPLKETRKIIAPASHRGAAELAAEGIISLRCRELGTPFVSARIFDMYGPRVFFSPRTGVISFLIDSFLRQEYIGVQGASKYRDFVHVSDVAAALTALLAIGFSGQVNIGTGDGVSLGEVCSNLQEHIPIIQPPHFVPDGRLPSLSAVADTQLLESLLEKTVGWNPRLLRREMPSLIDFRRKEIEGETDAAAILAAQRGLV